MTRGFVRPSNVVTAIVLQGSIDCTDRILNVTGYSSHTDIFYAQKALTTYHFMLL